MLQPTLWHSSYSLNILLHSSWPPWDCIWKSSHFRYLNRHMLLPTQNVQGRAAHLSNNFISIPHLHFKASPFMILFGFCFKSLLFSSSKQISLSCLSYHLIQTILNISARTFCLQDIRQVINTFIYINSIIYSLSQKTILNTNSMLPSMLELGR